VLPDDDQWQLYRAAFEQYKSEILNGTFSYDRFVERFFSYHLPVFNLNEADTRLHVMHVCELKELLESRRDLVNVYFSQDVFGKEDYVQMNKEFNTNDFVIKKPTVLACFNDDQISLISQFANEANLFMYPVNDADIRNLFSCSLAQPLRAKVNRRIAKFLDSLRNEGFLPHAWQKMVADNRLLSSSATGKPLSAHMLGSYLSDYKQGSDTLDGMCKQLTIKLKESM
jgi:hypothetical protein